MVLTIDIRGKHLSSFSYILMADVSCSIGPSSLLLLFSRMGCAGYLLLWRAIELLFALPKISEISFSHFLSRCTSKENQKEHGLAQQDFLFEGEKEERTPRY